MRLLATLSVVESQILSRSARPFFTGAIAGAKAERI